MNRRQALMSIEWTRPNPENIYCEEIPEELEAYEHWDKWRSDIEVVWPDEPRSSSNPPMAH